MQSGQTPSETPGHLAALILAWYDRHHRAMPWRVPPAVLKSGARTVGVRPDPYHVWLSEVMLQQTTVAVVERYFTAFTTRWPDVRALAGAPLEAVLAAWAGLGYYARARNLHRTAVAVAARPGGRFPETEAELVRLPGIGPYTSAAIAAIAFDHPATVVDGNVERVMARLHAETGPLPGVKARLREHARALTPRHRPGDHAQAVMDLGATICTPRRPACGACPWRDACRGRQAGISETLPRRASKRVRPIRLGTAFLALDGAGLVLTERRPERGLLGGMLALPSTGWAASPPALTPPFKADWRPAGEVRHTFTHFHLRLAVLWTRVEVLPGGVGPGEAPPDAEAAMPTVFAKASRLGRAAAGV
jgi:A/G-specific adenine glycosylase